MSIEFPDDASYDECHKKALSMNDILIDEWTDLFDVEDMLHKAELYIKTGTKEIKNGPMIKYVLLRTAMDRVNICTDLFENFCRLRKKIQWDNTLADLVILPKKLAPNDGEKGFDDIVSLFEIAGMTTMWSSVGCGDRFQHCALTALETLADLLDEEFNYVIIFKNTIEELEDPHDRHALIRPAMLEEHIVMNQDGKGRHFAYRIVDRLDKMEYITSENIITDPDQLQMFRDEMKAIKKEKEDQLAQLIRAREIAENEQDDDDDEEQEEKDPGAFDNWSEMMAKKMNPGEVTEHESFEIDPMAIHEPMQHGLILKKRFIEWKRISKDEDRNSLLFFRREFKSNSFLAHAHKLTTQWDKGIEGLEAATQQNVKKQKDKMAHQFSRYSRCRSTMDQLAGTSLKNDIQKPLSELESEFRVAHEENRKSLCQIIEAQDNIEQERRNIQTVRKFMGEFERLDNIKSNIASKSWSHIVNEYKLQQRKGNSGKNFGKLAEVNALINDLLATAREALLRDVLDNYKIDATSVERKIQQLEVMDYVNHTTGQCASQEWMENAIRSVCAELIQLEKVAMEEISQVKETERQRKLDSKKADLYRIEEGKLEPAELKERAKTEEKMRAVVNESWLESVICGKRFVQGINRVLESRLPLYNAVLSKLQKSHPDPVVRAEAKDTMPKLAEITELYCTKFKTCLGGLKHSLVTGDSVIDNAVSEIQLFIVNAPRAVLNAFHGCAISVDVISKLNALHEYALEQHIQTIYAKAAGRLELAYLNQNWVQDQENLKITEMSVEIMHEIQLMVDSVEALLSSQGQITSRKLVSKCGNNILELFKIFLDNIHCLAFGGHAVCGNKPEHMRLLYLINDVRQCRSVKLYDVLNDFERRFDTQPDEVQRENIEAIAGKNKLVDCLEQLMLNRYVFLKAQKLNAQITNSVMCTQFQWNKNKDLICDEPPYQVRSQVMEMLLSLVAVHSELYAHFAQHQRETRGPYVKGLMAIVDSIATAFTVSARMPDCYSQDGAWQFLVDIKFVSFVVDKYRSEYASNAFQDLENKFLGAAAAKGANRRADVLKKADEILKATKENTEHLFSCLGIRRDQESSRY